MTRVMLLLSFMIATLTSCSSPPPQKKPIVILFDVFPGFHHFLLAQEKGFFKKNGVDVCLDVKKDYTTIRTALLDGTADALCCVYSDILLANERGLAYKVVYVCDYSLTSDVIVSRPEIRTVADLKGKTISFEGINSFSQIFVLTALDKYKIPEYEMRFANIRASQALNALEKGQIDAAHTWEPYTSQLIQKGYKILVTAGQLPLGTIADVLSFKASLVKERPEDILAIIRSLFEALDYEKAHPGEAYAIMSKLSGLSEEEIKMGREGLFFPNIAENVALFTSKASPSLYSTGERIMDFHLKRGQISGRNLKKVEDSIDATFIQELAEQRGAK